MTGHKSCWKDSRSRALVIVGVAWASFIIATPCLARVFVLRPDGTGDVPTFQAGVDAILAEEVPCEPGTLLVEPGRYDETVHLGSPGCFGDVAAIICPEGSERTSVRALVLPETATPYVSDATVKIYGLTVEEPVASSSQEYLIGWSHCHFAGGFEWYTSFSNPSIERCTFNGRVVIENLTAFGRGIEDCRFERATVYTSNFIGAASFSRCVFKGPADTAVVVRPRDASFGFVDCTFRGFGSALAIPAGSYCYKELQIVRSRFGDIEGHAIAFPRNDQPSPPGCLPFLVTVDDSRFERCGSALSLLSLNGVHLEMSRDTVRACTGVGITAIVGEARLEDLLVSDCGSSGAEFSSVPSYYAGAHEHVHMNRATFVGNGGVGFSLRDTTGEPGFILPGDRHEIAGCTFAHNASTGLLLRTDDITIRDNVSRSKGGDGIGFEDTGACPDSLVRNTSALNGGNGIRCLAAPEQEPCRILTDASERLAGVDQRYARPAVTEGVVPYGRTIENNLVAGNAGTGLVVADLPGGDIRWNDAWMNAGGAYAGFAPGGENLTLDPQFCDVLAGDLHVQEGSPCAPSDPYGRIGALGAACRVSRVAIEVDPPGHGTINLKSNAPVFVAVLSNPVFDASQVDLGSLRFAGAAPAVRDHGVERPRVEDANGDGVPDLVVTFRARDLCLDPGESVAVLQGRTLAGTEIRGSQAVQVRGARGLASSQAEATTAPVLSASVSGRRVELDYSLTAPDQVDLAAFDVAGRRVATVAHELQDAGVRHAVWDAGDLPSGVYFMRLRTSRVVRVVVTPILK